MRQYFNRRLFSILLLGFSSGLPIGLINSTLQAWYTVSGVSLMTIGWLTLVGQPYAYKFMWAPLLDRWALFRGERRRSWILTMQCCLGVSLIAMAFFHPNQMPMTLAIVAVFVAIFSATQDTAIDAYRTELLSDSERGLGVSANTVAYRVAMIVSSGLALILASQLGFKTMYIIMGCSFFGLMWVTWKSPNPIETLVPPTTLKNVVIESWRSFFSTKNAVLILLFIVMYKLCDAVALSLSTTFLIRGVGFSLLQIGAISKIVGFSAALLGSVLGGVLMPYLGIYRSLWYFGMLQMLSNLLYAWLAVVGKNIVVMSIAIFGENFCSGLATVAFVVFLMQLCDRRYTATQYALFSATAALGRIFIGPLSAVIVQHFGWIDFYIFSSLIGLPSLILLWKFNQQALFQRVGEMDTVQSTAI